MTLASLSLPPANLPSVCHLSQATLALFELPTGLLEIPVYRQPPTSTPLTSFLETLLLHRLDFWRSGSGDSCLPTASHLNTASKPGAESKFASAASKPAVLSKLASAASKPAAVANPAAAQSKSTSAASKPAAVANPSCSPVQVYLCRVPSLPVKLYHGGACPGLPS